MDKEKVDKDKRDKDKVCKRQAKPHYKTKSKILILITEKD